MPRVVGFCMATLIGVLNVGSSSVKWAVYVVPSLGRVDGGQVADVAAAFDAIDAAAGGPLAAVGHRLVHGGESFTGPTLVTAEAVAKMRSLVSLSPTHLPAEVAGVEAALTRWSGVPQVACFDTAFFADLPAVARRLPIPREYADAGVRRYGFHGLSYEGLLEDLPAVAGPAATGRVVLAHLGNGCSMAAVLDGKPLDTSMGFTPAGGLVMGTRPGDLDPGVLTYLARTHGLDADGLDELIHRRCGLLGVSGTTADVRELLARRDADPRAAEALDLFARQAAKQVGAFATVLGGLDVLAFSGGVGEHAAPVRADVCGRLRTLSSRRKSG
jgi:acetate kinase